MEIVIKNLEEELQEERESRKVEEAYKESYVPPPPKDGASIPAPSELANVNTYPISSGLCPSFMTFPGIESSKEEHNVPDTEEEKKEPPISQNPKEENDNAEPTDEDKRRMEL